jgi:hypothetical protein
LWGKRHLHLESYHRGTRDLSKLQRRDGSIQALGNDAVGATAPVFDECRTIGHLGNDWIAWHQIVCARQIIGGDPCGEPSSAPDLETVIEERQRHRATSGRVITVDQGIDQDFTQGLRGKQSSVHTFKPAGFDSPRKKQVTLTQEQRFIQKLKRWAPYLPLVEGVGLVRACEACHPQFTLGEIR